jgi:hypothetical protein
MTKKHVGYKQPWADDPFGGVLLGVPLLAHLPDTVAPDDWQVIQRHLVTLAPCLLCRVFPATYAGLLVVEGSQTAEWCVFGYHLCPQCEALPEREVCAERQFLVELAGGRN